MGCFITYEQFILQRPIKNEEYRGYYSINGSELSKAWILKYKICKYKSKWP